MALACVACILHRVASSGDQAPILPHPVQGMFGMQGFRSQLQGRNNQASATNKLVVGSLLRAYVAVSPPPLPSNLC